MKSEVDEGESRSQMFMLNPSRELTHRTQMGLRSPLEKMLFRSYLSLCLQDMERGSFADDDSGTPYETRPKC